MTDKDKMREEFDAAWKTRSGLDENAYIGYEQAFVVWKLSAARTEQIANASAWIDSKPIRDAHKDIDSNMAGWNYIKKLEACAHKDAEHAAEIATVGSCVQGRMIEKITKDDEITMWFLAVDSTITSTCAYTEEDLIRTAEKNYHSSWYELEHYNVRAVQCAVKIKEPTK